MFTLDVKQQHNNKSFSKSFFFVVVVVVETLAAIPQDKNCHDFWCVDGYF